MTLDDSLENFYLKVVPAAFSVKYPNMFVVIVSEHCFATHFTGLLILQTFVCVLLVAFQL